MPEEEEIRVPVVSRVPGAKRKPRLDITKAKILLYGPPKIGKSTFASQFPGAWFLATEEGLDWLECHPPTTISSWDDFLSICAYIEEERPEVFGDGTPIRTIVLDTGELLFKMCHDHMLEVLGVGSMSDLEWGKGWSSLSDEFQRVMTKISRWPYGFIFICHSKEQEIKSKARSIDRIQPAIMTTGLKIIHTLCDIILYAYMDEVPERNVDTGELTGAIKQERVLQCHPKNNLIAGDRTGRLPEQIPLAYSELIRYFPDTDALTEEVSHEDESV